MTRTSPIRQPSRPLARPDPIQRRGGRYKPPSRTGRPAPVSASAMLSGAELPDIEPHVLACEGPHAVALMPASGGGYRYLLAYYQPVTASWVWRCSDPLRDNVLARLWWLECQHAEPLGFPDDPRFGLHLHSMLCGPSYPLDVSGLSAAQAAAVPHGLEWR